MEKIACFIHSTNLSLWEDTVLVQLLKRLKTTGLLEKMQHVCVVNTGEPLNVISIEKDYAPTKVINWSNSTMEFETCTIKQIVTYAKLHPDTRILYMHTKGISYSHDHVFVPGIQAWIDYMLHVLVDNHEKCLHLIKVYDTVGCNFRPDEDGNMQHYSGNFWWVRADYVQHLHVAHMKDKYEPEFWVLQNRPFLFNVHSIEHMYEQPYYLEDYKECVDRGFDDNVLFCKLGFHQAGLCNQLYSLANVLTVASLQQGNKVIILDDFVTDITTKLTKPSKHIIDLDALNVILKDDKIHVCYKTEIVMELITVEYGLKHKRTVNITDKVIQKFWKKNSLHIPVGFVLNDLCEEDPCPGLCKQVYIYYTLNGIPFMKVFHERVLAQRRAIKLNHANYDDKMDYFVNLPHIEPWLTLINRDSSKDMKHIFDSYLNKIPFLSMYSEMAQSFVDMIRLQQERISILHIRNEEDAIHHWAKINNIDEQTYSQEYEKKYVDAVSTMVSKSDLCVALTYYTENNPIITALRNKGYTVLCRPNLANAGREINALIDLLLCNHCESTFVGNFDPITMQGSTFSIAIYNRLLQNISVKKVIIDIEHIQTTTWFE